MEAGLYSFDVIKRHMEGLLCHVTLDNRVRLGKTHIATLAMGRMSMPNMDVKRMATSNMHSKHLPIGGTPPRATM